MPNYLKICILLLKISLFTSKTTKPNILLILVDDLGFYDVSYHNKNKGPLTPNIDALAKTGKILTNYYIQPICTPTRAALMTGRYPIRDGLQSEVILAGQRKALPNTPETQTFAERLNTCGYSSHCVGKWHLGHSSRKQWPTGRGFKSFSGYLLGVEDYYNRMTCFGNWGKPDPFRPGPCGLDFRENERRAATDEGNAGVYSSVLYTERVNSVIGAHDFDDDSLFIYYPMQSVHYPVEVPKKYSDKFAWVKDETRRTYFGMVNAMDESIGKIVDKLKQVGQFENTLIIFTSDNGGRHDVGGINYPLRGEKATIWQGGVRSAGFITGPGIPKNSSSDQLFHVTDWLPTVLSLVGCENKQDPKEQDGIDQARNLKNKNNVQDAEKSEILRSEILININPLHRSKIVDKRSWINTKFDIRQKAALVQGKWKIMTGTESSNTVYRPPEMDQTNLEKQNDNKIRFQPEPKKVDQSNQTVFLFDLDTDESESIDVSSDNQDLVNSLLKRLEYYETLQVPPQNYPGMEELASPKLHGGYWDAWVDE